MVSLTSLLVLAAIFSQTSNAIPKTAYLKLIDLWFVFLIVMEFLIVLILVIVENLRLRKKQIHPSTAVTVISVKTMSREKLPLEGATGTMSSSTMQEDQEVNKTARTTNTVARIFLPILMLFFIGGYGGICLAAANS